MWFAALSHEQQADWFLGRALDVPGLAVEERLADKRIDHPASPGRMEVWRAWLLRSSERNVELSAVVDRPRRAAVDQHRHRDFPRPAAQG